MLISIETKNPLRETEKAVEKCFKCATCALVCPITRYVEGCSPTKSFVYEIFSSPDPTANPNLWSDPICHQCHEVCPQDVNPAEAIENLKEMAFERGRAPPMVVALVKTVINTGVSSPLSEASRKRREQLGLPPFAPKRVEDLRLIARNTGLEEKLKKLETRKEAK